jgi:hypothetical protein
MRFPVKPRPAFSRLRLGRRGPSTPPASCRRARTSLPLSCTAFFPRRRPPLTHGGGGRRRGKNARWSCGHATGLPLSLRVGRRVWGPGPDARATVYPCGTPSAPSTCYRVRLQACGTPKHEPTHRTNGALAGSPGGTTAARPDSSRPDPSARPCPLLSAGHGVGLHAPAAPHTVAAAAAAWACRRAVESTRSRQSFSWAPSGSSPRSR